MTTGNSSQAAADVLRQQQEARDIRDEWMLTPEQRFEFEQRQDDAARAARMGAVGVLGDLES